ncbi:MAG: gliding motility-associated C-terminal domain-containing protein [bacterium]
MLLIFILLNTSRIIITEVMSNVEGPENPYGDRNEFVEIYNLSSDTIDLSLYFISDFDANPDEICAWDNESILIKYPDVRIHSTLIYPASYALILDREYIVPDSVNCQPYSIAPGTLVLTTDDTSIGNELASNDPLIIFSPADACTTSFGTPNSEDNFPSDPGDGISWERIDLYLTDTITNWHPCIASTGCTPGYENSVTNAFDLALNENLISSIPAKIATGEDANLCIGIINAGLRPTVDYNLSIFDDKNCDSILETSELLANIPGELVGAFDTVFLYWKYNKPAQGEHLLGFKIDFDEDKNLANNTAFKNLQVLGKIGELCLTPAIFTPDGDGKNDNLQIDYRLPESGGELTISIYNSRGIKICDLCRKKFVNGDKGTLYWNVETAKEKISTGMYVVYLEYSYRNKITKAKKTAVLAR